MWFTHLIASTGLELDPCGSPVLHTGPSFVSLVGNQVPRKSSSRLKSANSSGHGQRWWGPSPFRGDQTFSGLSLGLHFTYEDCAAGAPGQARDRWHSSVWPCLRPVLSQGPPPAFILGLCTLNDFFLKFHSPVPSLLIKSTAFCVCSVN